MLLSAAFLGETAVARRWIAVALSFGAVLLIARPGGAISPTNAVLPLATAVLFALYQALTSRVGPTTRPMVTLFYTVIVGSVVMTAVALPTWRMPDGHEAALLLAVGALGFAAHLALIHAFTIAPASLLATFDYSRLVWATLAGALLFGTIPDALSAVGMGCILGCGSRCLGGNGGLRDPRGAARSETHAVMGHVAGTSGRAASGGRFTRPARRPLVRVARSSQATLVQARC